MKYCLPHFMAVALPRSSSRSPRCRSARSHGQRSYPVPAIDWVCHLWRRDHTPFHRGLVARLPDALFSLRVSHFIIIPSTAVPCVFFPGSLPLLRDLAVSPPGSRFAVWAHFQFFLGMTHYRTCFPRNCFSPFSIVLTPLLVFPECFLRQLMPAYISRLVLTILKVSGHPGSLSFCSLRMPLFLIFLHPFSAGDDLPIELPREFWIRGQARTTL